MPTVSPSGGTLRAAVLYGPGDVQAEEIAHPPAEGEQVRLRMRSVGICGSDLHVFREGSTGTEDNEEPFVLGHEIAAEVTEESAGRLGMAPGTIVAVDPAHPCEECEWCRRGHHNLCPHVEFKGVIGHQGGLAESIAVYPHQVVPVPHDFDADTAALLEPLGVAIHAVDLAGLRPMDTVVVLGAGPIGLLIQQVVQTSGAGECFVIDPKEYRTAVADRLGAARTSASHEALDDWTDARGADVVIEATNSPEGFEHAVEAARIGGRVVLVGIPEGNEYTLTASPARRKALTIKFSRRMGEVYDRAIRMVASGRVDVDPLVTHRFPLEKAPEALALQSRYDDGIIKAVVYQQSAG